MKQASLDYEGYKSYTGKDKYLFDFEDGDCFIRVDYYSDKPVEVWLVLPDLVLPYHDDRCGHLNLRVQKCCGVELRAPKNATIVARVGHQLVRGPQTMDFTPVELTPPDLISLQLSQLIDNRARAALAHYGIDPGEIEINEADDLDDEGDDSDLEFGPGYSEMDEDGEYDPPPNPPPSASGSPLAAESPPVGTNGAVGSPDEPELPLTLKAT